jgi:hypothetical protein
MIIPYRDDLSDPKANAQRNLSGRTHFVDDGTLAWHRSRVLHASAQADGLLFALTVSNGSDSGGLREYLAVVFDVFGHVIDRTTLEAKYDTHKKALKALELALIELTPRAIELTRAAIEREQKHFASDVEGLRVRLRDLEARDDAQPKL